MPTTAPRRTHRGNAFVAAFINAKMGDDASSFGDDEEEDDEEEDDEDEDEDETGALDPPFSSGTPYAVP
jgi:hypothetical protein